MPDRKSLVVDASAVAALLFGEPEGEDMARRLTGRPLVAPLLLPFEVANVCLVKARRHPESRDALFAAHGLLGSLGIRLFPVEGDALVDLAERNGLTAYDAAYLLLARSLDAELVTLDRKLAAAAK